jgi:hypothetical protein
MKTKRQWFTWLFVTSALIMGACSAVVLSTGTAHAQDAIAGPVFDTNRFEKVLPSGWRIQTITKDRYPYGFLRGTSNDGLEVLLTGPTGVKGKGGPEKVGIAIWIMALSYKAKTVPSQGTPDSPSWVIGTPEPAARSIGTNQYYHIFARPYPSMDPPTWITWPKDLAAFFGTRPK